MSLINRPMTMEDAEEVVSRVKDQGLCSTVHPHVVGSLIPAHMLSLYNQPNLEPMPKEGQSQKTSKVVFSLVDIEGEDDLPEGTLEVGGDYQITPLQEVIESIANYLDRAVPDATQEIEESGKQPSNPLIEPGSGS